MKQLHAPNQSVNASTVGKDLRQFPTLFFVRDRNKQDYRRGRTKLMCVDTWAHRGKKPDMYK
jgi:hypothetical protein